MGGAEGSQDATAYLSGASGSLAFSGLLRHCARGAVGARQCRLPGDHRTIRQRDVRRIAQEPDLADAEFRQRPRRLRAVGIGHQHLELGEIRIRRRQPAVAIRIEGRAERRKVRGGGGVPLGEDIFPLLADLVVAIGIEEQHPVASAHPRGAMQEAIAAGIHEHIRPRQLRDLDAVAVKVEDNGLGPVGPRRIIATPRGLSAIALAAAGCAHPAQMDFRSHQGGLFTADDLSK